MAAHKKISSKVNGCKQAHLFGWGAAAKSWREEWGASFISPVSPVLGCLFVAVDRDTLPKQVSLLPGGGGTPANFG